MRGHAAQLARCSATTRRTARRSCSSSRWTGPSSTAPRRCSCPSSPPTAHGSTTSAGGCSRARARAAAARPGRQGRHVVERSCHRRAGQRRRTFDRADWVAAAERCAGHVLDVHLVDGELRRASRLGAVGTARAVADDHGNLAEGLLVLHQATGELRWLDAAATPARLRRDFAADDGGFHDTAARRRAALPAPAQRRRQRGAGRAVRSRSSPRHARRGDGRRRSTRAPARAPRAAGLGLAVREPRFGGWSLAVAEALVAGPLQVAVVGSGPAADGARAGGATLPQPRARRRPRRAGRTGDPAARRTPARGRRARGLRLPGDGVRAADDRPVRPRRAAGVTGAFDPLLKPRTAQ